MFLQLKCFSSSSLLLAPLPQKIHWIVTSNNSKMWSYWEMRSIHAQSCPTLCGPRDCSPPGFSVHEIFQARLLEWLAISSSKGSSRPWDQICVSHVSCTSRQIFTTAPPRSPEVITDTVKFKLKWGHNELGWALNPFVFIRKRPCVGTSLVVQWLKLCTPTAGARILSLAGELNPTCHKLKISYTGSKTWCRQIYKN